MQISLVEVIVLQTLAAQTGVNRSKITSRKTKSDRGTWELERKSHLHFSHSLSCCKHERIFKQKVSKYGTNVEYSWLIKTLCILGYYESDLQKALL